MKARLDFNTLKAFIQITDELDSFFANAIRDNGKIYFEKNVNRFVQKPITDDRYKDLSEKQREIKSRCILKAYQIWGCGAYSKKQRLFARLDRDNFLREIWNNAYAAYNTEELNLYFKTILYYENDKFRQGAKVIELILEVYDVVSSKLYMDDQVAICQNLLPLSELFLGCLLAILEKSFRPEKMHKKATVFYQYSHEVESYFQIDTDKLKQISGL